MKKIEGFEPELDQTLSDKRMRLYAEIAEWAIKKIRQPGAFAASGQVSLDAEGNGVDIWSEQSVQSDILGWLLKASAATLNDTSERRELCISATTHIGRRARALTGRSIIDINDNDGCEAVIDVLKKTADSFREQIENNASRDRVQAARSQLRWRAGM